jgi:glycosyl transferase family 2
VSIKDKTYSVVLSDRLVHGGGSARYVARLSRPREPTVSVVVPALNEAENLPYVLPRIDPSYEVVLVDGQSVDGTGELAPSLHPRVRVISQPGRGKGDGLRAGFATATGDIIVAIDADGSTDPAEIPAFVGALIAGADFVKGSRFLQGAGTADMPYHRQLGNRSLTLVVRLLFGGRYSDLCYGYNAFWRDVSEQVQARADGFEVETAMSINALKAGLKVVEVASFESARIHGAAKLRTFPDGWRVLRTILSERLSRTTRCAEPQPVEFACASDAGASADRTAPREAHPQRGQRPAGPALPESSATRYPGFGSEQGDGPGRVAA